MYNLIVTAQEDQWEKLSGSHRLSPERFLEFTEPQIRDRFRTLTPEIATELCTFPTLFAYERDVRRPARMGRVIQITQDGSYIGYAIQIAPNAPVIDPDTLHDMRPALGIDEDFEMMRTHWAIKDVDLAEVIRTPPYVKENRVRRDANQIALKAVRSILDSAEPFEISIAETSIKVNAQRLGAEAWPAGTWGLDEERDGPWPQPVLLDCSWPGGKTQVVAAAQRAGGKHRDLVSILVSVRLTSQQLVWINVAALLREDAGEEVPFTASFSLSTRIPEAHDEKQRRAIRVEAAKRLVRQSGLPLAGQSSIDAFRITLPEGRVVPSQGVALRRLAQLALLKLPFWMRDQVDAIEGVPYLDPYNSKWRASESGARRLVGSSTETEPHLMEEPDSSEADSDESGTADSSSAPAASPSRWHDARLELEPVIVRPFFAKHDLEVAESLVQQICAAISSGKHLLLVGPPGTGKTKIATALADGARSAGYCSGAFVGTASADWSTFDTIGGYAMDKDGRFSFRPGVFLRAIEQQKWLLLDEVNRADIDRSFGELMTVLAGGRTDTPFTQQNGTAISIGPASGESHVIPPTFRVLATMNTWDKTSLFRLSYAVQRRFAVIYVGPPQDAEYAKLVGRHASSSNGDPGLSDDARVRMERFFSSNGVLSHRAIGPAIAIDMVNYQRRRQAGGNGLAEACVLFLLPQLEGLGVDSAAKVLASIEGDLSGWADDEAVANLRARFIDLFPSIVLTA